MTQVHCRSCGRALPPDSVYCPGCRVEAKPVPIRAHTDSAAVVLALIFVFPLGLYLMWRSSNWSTEVKWGISGLFLPPLWSYFIWRSKVGIAFKMMLSAALLGLVELFDVAVLRISGTAPWVILLLHLLIVFLIARASFSADAEDRAYHRAIEGKLDACDDLIAEIELYQLPSGSPLNPTYLRALEMRQQGRHLLESALGAVDLVAADARLTEALAALQVVSCGLTTMNRCRSERKETG